MEKKMKKVLSILLTVSVAKAVQTSFPVPHHHFDLSHIQTGLPVNITPTPTPIMGKGPVDFLSFLKHFSRTLQFPTPQEQLATDEIMMGFSFGNVIMKMHTLIKTHVDTNPELKKALDIFKTEVRESILRLKEPIKNSLNVIHMEKIFIDEDIVRSAGAIFVSLGKLIDTLQHNPLQTLTPADNTHIRDIFKNVLNHITAIALKTHEHFERPQDLQAQAKVIVKK
jgi:hypothetical protein